MDLYEAQRQSIVQKLTHFDLVSSGGLRQLCVWVDVDLGVFRFTRSARPAMLIQDAPTDLTVENLHTPISRVVTPDPTRPDNRPDNPLGDMTALEVLGAIETWVETKMLLHDGDDRFKSEPRRLWAVLSAMRGPDNSDFELKAYTTQVLRGLVLPKLAKESGSMVADSQYISRSYLEELRTFHKLPRIPPANSGEEVSENIRKYRDEEEDRRGGRHFMDHVALAAEAIHQMREEVR